MKADKIELYLKPSGNELERAEGYENVTLKETARTTPLDNVIDVHVAHLRRKVDDGRETTLIQTVRGVGFVIREERRA